MSNLVIVSNRGPFSFSEDFLAKAEACLKEGRQPEELSFGEGGLVQAMAGLLKPGRWETTWIGASMGDRDIDVARGHYTGLFHHMKKNRFAPDQFPHIEIDPETRMHFRYKEYDFYMRFVFFDTKHMHSYYSKFANGFLWPLMHLTRSPLFYKKTRVFPRPYFEKNDFVQYSSSNVTFANTIIDEIRKSREKRTPKRRIVIWNQDYHLMQIAEVYKALLEEEGIPEDEREKMHVGQFIHTPFFNIHEIQGLIREDKRNRIKAHIYDPFGETIETVLQKLIWGMLANDFIGFHTKEYCDNYLEALQEWFPVEIRIMEKFYEVAHQDSVTTIGALPIGLDVDKILSEVTPEKELTYKIGGNNLANQITADKKAARYIFGGLDRCDYTKGLVERVSIFSHALIRLRNSLRDARFYQITSPSRSENPDYQNLHAILREQVKKLNRKFSNDPIVYLSDGITAPQNYRLMREIDVMLVTPLEDGMNLVAFEYILSQKYNHPDRRGILVLSACGASRVLKQKGFDQRDGIIYINPMRPKEAGEKIMAALKSGSHLSEKVINYVENERRIEDWAAQNIEAILHSRRIP
ncbi:MAG: trehalose-6-phosphate synthase [Deltaproteobacteria bacterium]|nr:trehalose-6-phosphate synthase [Deltaproteobacteria bacterium]MBW2071760.1 trehalose-6-phosphate synthase [Deltaproteobacteria bacterium]